MNPDLGRAHVREAEAALSEGETTATGAIALSCDTEMTGNAITRKRPRGTQISKKPRKARTMKTKRVDENGSDLLNGCDDQQDGRGANDARMNPDLGRAHVREAEAALSEGETTATGAIALSCDTEMTGNAITRKRPRGTQISKKPRKARTMKTKRVDENGSDLFNGCKNRADDGATGDAISNSMDVIVSEKEVYELEVAKETENLTSIDILQRIRKLEEDGVANKNDNAALRRRMDEDGVAYKNENAALRRRIIEIEMEYM